MIELDVKNDNGKLFAKNFLVLEPFSLEHKPGELAKINTGGQQLGTAEVLTHRAINFRDLQDELTQLDSGRTTVQKGLVLTRRFGRLEAYDKISIMVCSWKELQKDVMAELSQHYFEHNF